MVSSQRRTERWWLPIFRENFSAIQLELLGPTYFGMSSSLQVRIIRQNWGFFTLSLSARRGRQKLHVAGLWSRSADVLGCSLVSHPLRYAALTSWWSIISHDVHHLGGNKISHELKTRPWNSFRVRHGTGRTDVDRSVLIGSCNFFFFSISEYIEEIKSGEEKFESLASQLSDCSSARNGGDLGLFGRGTHSSTQWVPHSTAQAKLSVHPNKDELEITRHTLRHCSDTDRQILRFLLFEKC